jgi:hypothetical protein
MNDDYTKVDAPLDRFMGIKRVVDKKTKKVRRYMTTPVQPTQTEKTMNGGIPEGYMIGSPIAKSKTKRYFSQA